MMYSNNFAAAIKVNGKILREFGDTVYIPFGSEYQIRLKNLSSNRAKVKVQIDGKDVTDGGLVLNALSTVDLERFIRNGNLKEGNHFKFIERTSKIEEHRGIKLEDGLITIIYEFEIPYVQSQYALINSRPSYNVMRSPINLNCSLSNEKGITVEGSKSNQSFETTYWRGSHGAINVFTIKLLGETEDNKKIREPVTVKTKLECKTCGTVNSATSKFCSECGTSLQIV